MKKFTIFLAITVIIICGIYGIYINYKAIYNTSKKSNYEYQKYLNKEVYGSDLMTVINKAIDNNEFNNVEKNNKGYYNDNNQNSINIEIKMLDNDSTYKMETIYNSGIQNFLKYYSGIKFKCTNIKYHENTNKVKYMLFEQITQ